MDQLEISVTVHDRTDPNVVEISTRQSGRLRVVLVGQGVLFDGEIIGNPHG